MVRLNLWYNKIQKIPNSFRHLQKLQFLSLAENELSELNESITECVGLHKLIVHSNRITAVPARLGNLINLEMLDFQDNFVGLLP